MGRSDKVSVDIYDLVELKTHEKRKVTVLFISNFCRFTKYSLQRKEIKRLTAKYQITANALCIAKLHTAIAVFLKTCNSQSILYFKFKHGYTL